MPGFRRVGVLIAWAILGLVGLVVAAGVVLHLPPVRAAVLRYAVDRLEGTGLRLEAARIDYNLLTLSAGLTDLTVAAAGSPGQPFFEAARVSVVLDSAVLGGELRFADVAIADGRVTVLEQADGTSNLPGGGDGDGGPPPSIAIEQLTLDGLAVVLERPGLSVDVPRLDAELTPTTGTMAIAAPVTIDLGDTRAVVEQLSGGVSFDGRVLTLRQVEVVTDDVTATLNGTLGVLTEAPELALDMTASGRVERLVRWGGLAPQDAPTGQVTLDIAARGPLGAPSAALVATVPQLNWQDFTFADVRMDGAVDAAGFDVESLTLETAGGTVAAAGGVGFGALARLELDAEWDGVELAALTAALASGDVRPDGVTSGTAHVEGPVAEVGMWTAALDAAVTGGGADGIALPGRLQLTLDEGAWGLEASHRVAASVPVDLDLGGRLAPEDWGASTVGGTVTVPETTLEALGDALAAAGVLDATGREGLDGRLAVAARIDGTAAAPEVAAEATATDLTAPGLTASRLDLTVDGGLRAGGPLAFTVTGPRVETGGQPLADLDVAGAFDDGVVTFERVRAVQPDATGRLDLTGLYRIDARGYAVSGTLVDWALQPTDAVPAAGTVSVEVAGEGTLDAPAGSATLTVADARWSDTLLGTIEAGVEAADGEAQITAAVPVFGVTAMGRLATAAPYAAAFDVAAAGTDLARVVGALDLPVTVTGTADLQAHAEGELTDWRDGDLAVTLSSLDARLNDAPLTIAAPAELRYAGGRVEVAALDAQLGMLRLTAGGTLALDEAAAAGAEPFTLEADGEMADVITLAEALGLTDLPPVTASGPVTLMARATGTLGAPVLTADLAVGPGPLQFADLPPVTEVQVLVRVADGRVELIEAAGAYQGARLGATGGAPLSLFGLEVPGAAGGAASLSLRMTGVTSRVLAPVLSPDALARMAGILDLSVDVSSPSLALADVTGEVRLDRFLMAVSGVPISQAAPTRLVADNGVLRVDTWNWTGTGAELQVDGEIQLAARQLDLTTEGSLDLRLLTPFLREAGIAPRGQVRPRLAVTGPFDAPDVAGELALENGELQMAEPRLLVSDLTLRAELARPRLEIVELSGQVNGGTLTGEGDLVFEPGAGSSGGLQLAVDGMALEFPDGLRSEIDADLDLALTGGSEATPLGGRLGGRVVVVRAAYREQLSAFGSLLGALDADDAIVQVAAAEPGLASRLRLDLALVTDEALLVDNNYGQLQVTADLRLLGTAARPALSGRALIQEGGQLFVGANTYTITQGAIDFADPTGIEPDFNVVAATRVGGEDIEVTISGTPDDLSIDPVSISSPELSRTDVQALLLTGRTFDELASADAAGLGVQLARSFSGDVLGVAGQAVGLDTLRLGGVDTGRLRDDSANLATETDPTSRLTFGRSLGSNVNLTFSQSLIDGGAQTWILDYQPIRRVELRLVSDDDNQRAYSVRHEITFGDDAATPAAGARREEPRVTAVRIEGTPVLPEAEVRDALGLDPGDRFGFPEWLDDRDALRALYAERGYLTATIDATRTAPEMGVILTYTIQAGPPTEVRVTGRPLGNDVVDAVETAWLNSVSDDFLVEEVEELVRVALARDGLFDATVGVTFGEQAGARVLAIAVNGGQQTGGLEPRVTGAPPDLADEVASRLRATALAERAAQDRDGLADEVTALVRSRGYLNAEVSVDPVIVDEDTAVLPVRVQPGPVFLVGAVGLDGTGPLDAQLVRGVVTLVPGEPYDPARAVQSRDEVAALYYQEGFQDVDVVAREQRREEAGEVDVTFVVTPGPREVLREVAVLNNTDVSEAAVLDAFRLPEGAPIRAEEWLEARIRLFDTELFRRVDLTREPIGEPDAGIQPVRAVIEVDEWPTLRLRYGFEVAEERPVDNVEGTDLVPGVRADVLRRTLFGRAVNVGLTAQAQRREQSGRTFVRLPQLFGLPLESQFVVRYAREEIENVTLRTTVTGVAWEQRYRFSPTLLLSYSYDFERNHTLDTQPAPGEPVFDSRFNIAKIRANLSWDTRDDPVDATRGHLVTTALEFSPDGLGSDLSYARSLTQAYWFRPWRDVVFASAGRFGVIRPLSDLPLVRSTLFFTGGARSVRGVPENTLGGLDFIGDPAGGEMLLVMNQEVRLPLYGWLRGVAFVDLGDVAPTPADFAFGRLTGSAGVGLRLDSPFGLFRVDWGTQVWNPVGEGGSRVTFGIGQAF